MHCLSNARKQSWNTTFCWQVCLPLGEVGECIFIVLEMISEGLHISCQSLYDFMFSRDGATIRDSLSSVPLRSLQRVNDIVM